MSTGPKIKLEEARGSANRIVDLLSESCEQIYIAGSIRRQKPEVGDIELVAIPRHQMSAQMDMFGVGNLDNLLHERTEELLKDGTIRQGEKKAWGERYRKFIFGGMRIDLFMADEVNIGYQLLLRTGPADFCRKIVTQRYKGGYLPDSYKFDKGYLWQHGSIVPCPNEEFLFSEVLGLEYIKPEDRG